MAIWQHQKKKYLFLLNIRKEYSQKLLNQREPTNKEDMDLTEDLDPQEVKNPGILDVEIAIKRLKTRKTPGMDNLPSELFKDEET